MHIGDGAAEVCAGQVVFIPAGAVQHIANTGDTRLAFLAIVDSMWVASDDGQVA